MAASDQIPLGSGFAAKSEPDQIMSGVDLGGKTAIVTGGYSGIGVETVRALAKAGARVIVPTRNREKADANLADVDGDVTLADLDLADLATVRAFTTKMNAELDRLDLLINNAGVMACPEARVGPGWESQFGTNHMGHFAMTLGLMSLLERGEDTRVVALTSIAHKRSDVLWDDVHFERTPYDKWIAYGQAKTANSLFALGLNRRLADSGGRAFTVHPGGIFTPLQRHLPTEEQIELGWLDVDGKPNPAAAAIFKTPAQGCTTTLWAATSPMLADKGGLYCEDCDVAKLATADSPPFLHVAPWAVDDEAAERLWTLSEELLAKA
jgi:NAD(P)-dependent dehydrogenase (short-subunit alcohol dehydrogenase family)